MKIFIIPHNIAVAMLRAAGIALILLYSISLLGGIIGFFSIIGKTTEEITQLLKIEPRFPQLIYFGAISGLLTAPIYIFAAINLLRLRSWARKFLIWFIPVMLLFDISYLLLVDIINKSTVSSIIIDFIIWVVLLNKSIKDIFKDNIAVNVGEK